MEYKKDACCFTGHRIIARDNILKIQKEISKQIEFLIEKNVSKFLCGGAIGFDMISAFEVLKLKEKYPHIQLHLIVPFKGHYNRWVPKDKFKYKQLADQCNKEIYVSETPDIGSIFLRNRALVDSSNYCIAYYDKNRYKGGTKYTINYAIKNHVELILINI